MRTDLRGQVGWLIAIRAMISTLLLGGATVARITAPDSFAVDPFFLLIAVTYVVTIVSAATLGLVDRHRWLERWRRGSLEFPRSDAGPGSESGSESRPESRPEPEPGS